MRPWRQTPACLGELLEGGIEPLLVDRPHRLDAHGAGVHGIEDVMFITDGIIFVHDVLCHILIADGIGDGGLDMLLNRILHLIDQRFDSLVVVIELNAAVEEHFVIDLIGEGVHTGILESFEGGVLGDVLKMVVHVLRKALVLRHLGHLHEVALAAFEKPLRVGLLNPLVVVGEPLEQVVIIEVYIAVGDLRNGIGDVAVVFGYLVAVVTDVETFLQLLDGREPFGYHGMLESVLCIAFGLRSGHALLDFIHVLVKRLGDGGEGGRIEREAVLEPIEGLLACLVGADGSRGLVEAKLVSKIVDIVAVHGERIGDQGGEHVGGGGLTMDFRVALVAGAERLIARSAELAEVLAVGWGEVPFLLAEDFEVES